MRETYWDQFMATGSVQDYLNYKMKEASPGGRPDLAEQQRQRGKTSEGYQKMSAAAETDFDKRKEQCESDRTYRDGAFHSASW